MRNLFLLITLTFLLFCLCGCVAENNVEDSTAPESSTQDTSESTTEAAASSEPAEQTVSDNFITATDVIPLYDTDSSELFIIPADTQKEAVYEAAYYHLNGYGHFYASNVFNICIDDAEYNQGSHYTTYVIENEEFRSLENNSFSRSYDLFGTTYQIVFDYSVYGDQIILTYIPESSTVPNIRYIACLNAHTYLVEIAEPIAVGNVVYHLMALDLNTGELSDYLTGIDAENRQIISKQIKRFVSLDQNRFLIDQVDGTFCFVDTASNVVCELDRLLNTVILNCSIIGESIVCWNENGDFWKVNCSDLSFRPLLTNVYSFNASGIQNGNGSPYMIYTDREEYHIFNFETEEDRIFSPPSGWDLHLESQGISPDGRKFYAISLDNQDRFQILVLDFDDIKFTELLRVNENQVRESDVSWTADNKIIIHARDAGGYSCYIYDIE